MTRPEGMPPGLGIALSAAVPLHIVELAGWSADRLVAEGRRCAGIVGSEGDNILFRSARRGGTARAFNALARGLAVLAHAPGGVEFAGQRWEVARSVLTVEQAEPVARRVRVVVDVPVRDGLL